MLWCMHRETRALRPRKGRGGNLVSVVLKGRRLHQLVGARVAVEEHPEGGVAGIAVEVVHHYTVVGSKLGQTA
jgi:hypothetical protein